MLETYTPGELQKFWNEQREQSEASKPEDVRLKEPEAIQIYKGDCWASVKKEEQPNIVSSVNMVYAAVKSFLPQVMTKEPKPACLSPMGNDKYAELHNTLKAYRDRELGAIEVNQRVLLDCFLRGTGCARHDRDIKRGMARTSYFSVMDLLWDHNACTPKEAKHLIETHQCYRWEFAKKFGKDIAGKVKADQPASSTTPRGEPSPLDRIKYYLCWSKHDGENRVYAIHPEWNDGYLNVGEDGRPGEPFPFVFDDDEWHITPLIFNRTNESPWGFGYYRAVRGPILFMQFVVSYILAASKKSCLQAVTFPKELQQFAEKLGNTTKHLEFIPFDSGDLAGRSIKDMVNIFEFPDLHPSLFKAMETANSVHDKVSGFNAIQQGDAGAVETAAESVRMSDVAENRVAEDLRMVGKWLEDCWGKEAQIDCKMTPKRSVVCVKQGMYSEEDEPPEGIVPTTELDQKQQEQIKADIPYAAAILLERGVGDLNSANEKVQAKQLADQVVPTLQPEVQQGMQLAQMIGQPPPPELQEKAKYLQTLMQNGQLTPEIQARQQFEIPLEATVEIIEPGVEAFVGPELAQFWLENMTDREIKAELQIRIEQGSTRRLGHLQKFNEYMQLYKLFGGFFVEWEMDDQVVDLHNAVVDAMESFSLEGIKITKEQIQAFRQKQQMMMQQQQQMQAQQQMQQQQQEGESKQQIERQKAKDKSDQEREREGRDRRKDLQKAQLDAMKQGATAA